ncbi:acyl-CoA dehydrogenase family protein [uncultured Deinococcus sp.]|uniref:acyl-CoA dehydrogenase family protein n=1 Tax=uncultured Deinococcus sp. TaxID=158789 RepID=UPI002590A921|nr:acyl-CoA dehydrogenase family protein [uncultured Deinococcus sp.]
MLLLPDPVRPEVRQVTRRAAEAIAAHLAACEAAQDVTPQAAAALKASGYAALTVPEAFGGLGATLPEFALTQEHLGRAGASLALVLAMNGHVLGSAFGARSWPEPLLARLGQGAARGELLNAVASERNLGSPSRGGLPETTLIPQGDGYRLDGRKTWSTGARALDTALVTAALDGQVVRVRVDMHAPGVDIETTWGGSLALRGSGSQDLVFSGMSVSAQDLAPPTPPSPVSPAWFWTALSGTYLGVGTAALAELRRYAVMRVPTALGRPIATLPRVRETAGRIHAELWAARALLAHATQAFHADPTDAALPLLAGAKAVCAQAAVNATDQAARAVGGAALSPDQPFERLLRDARAALTHPPTEPEAYERLGGLLMDAAEEGVYSVP